VIGLTVGNVEGKVEGVLDGCGVSTIGILVGTEEGNDGDIDGAPVGDEG
jgi:hypothetical protein